MALTRPRRTGGERCRHGAAVLWLALWLGSWLAQSLALWHGIDHRAGLAATAPSGAAVVRLANHRSAAQDLARVHDRELQARQGPGHDWGHDADSGECRLIDQLLTGQAPLLAQPHLPAPVVPACTGPARPAATLRSWARHGYQARAPPRG